MPLETANYIPELVETNPDGTDLASTLDNHDRLIKTAIKGSFPAFVGTTGSPAFVSKTEAQINDAAELSANNDFTGDNTINSNPVAVQRISERAITGNSIVEQTDEQNVIRFTGSSATLTFNTLALGTVGTVKNLGSGNLTLTEGTALLTHLAGTGTPATGNRILNPGAVMEYHYTATGQVEIWGNGIT